MLELYGLAPEIRIFFTVMLAIAVAAQTLRIFLLVAHKEYKVPRTVLLQEVFILVHFIPATVLMSMTLLQKNIIAGFSHEIWRVDLIPIVLGVLIVIKHKKPEPFISSMLLLISMLFGAFPFYQYLFLVVHLYLIFRSVVLLDLEWQRVRMNISRLSIKEAVELIPAGILYANDNGRTLIVNPSMNRLFGALNIKAVAEVSSLWSSLASIQNSDKASVMALDDKLLIRIINAGSWLITKEEIVVKKKRFLQLLAIDITEEDLLTREMEERNNALEESGREIVAAINNIEQLEKEREILRMKTRVHDIIGQRLSILSRLLENDMGAAELIAKIEPLLTDMTQAIADTVDTSPEHLLFSLTRSFSLIGTEVCLNGKLPRDQNTAGVFAAVIRECATNAVRHADATNVYVQLKENQEEYALIVSNDGKPPSDHIVEGGGITGMRRQVRELSGVFDISQWPQFQIHIRIPKNRKDGCYD